MNGVLITALTIDIQEQQIYNNNKIRIGKEEAIDRGNIKQEKCSKKEVFKSMKKR